ncbi:MAG: signal recognition particle-docking protein FtsY, partial [Hamadaea sp.]|nr:signal recognition particle-docking protein FtsY [Hamadaea sp.]
MENLVLPLVVLIVLVVATLVAVTVVRRRRAALPERPAATPAAPEAKEAPAAVEPKVETAPSPPAAEAEPAQPEIEVPEPTAGRLVRLRSRLARSQNAFGRGLLAVLSRDRLDDDAWEEIEESLIGADVGVEATGQIVAKLRERTRILGTRTVAEVRTLLADELTEALDPKLDRSLAATPQDGRPAVILVVGVNGAGKTTTCGKI